MQSHRVAWLGTGAALLVSLGLASMLPSAPVSAAPSVRVAQELDPTLQALATQAALAVSQAALIPTPNPTDLARAIDASGAITIHGNLTIAGDVNISAPYTSQVFNLAGIRPDLVSCASFAQGIRNSDGTGFGVPAPSLVETIGGHTVIIPVSLSPYSGPGDYARDSGVQLGPGLVVDGTNYLATDDSADYHVTVNSDGSGSFSFANLHSASLATGTVNSAAISGSNVWTCAPQP